MTNDVLTDDEKKATGVVFGGQNLVQGLNLGSGVNNTKTLRDEIAKRDVVLDKILHRISQWQEDSGVLGDIWDDITTLKTTTGHDNNTEKRGKR